MVRDTLLREITILDFMAIDLQLFLNTNPTNGEALIMYNDCVTRSNQLKKQYEADYGPLTSFRSDGQPNWNWITEPWPWEEQFNFDLAETL